MATAAYPAQKRVFTDKVDDVDIVYSDHVNLLQAEMEAVQGELGTTPSGAHSTVAAYLSSLNTVKYESGSTLKAASGTATNPGHGFSAETGLGIHRPAVGTMALVAGEVEVLRMTSAGSTATTLEVTNTLTVSGGLNVTGTVSGIDHSEVTGLTTGDPHTQYLLASGTRNLTGTLLPSTNKTIALGSATRHWSNVFANVITLDGGEATVDKVIDFGHREYATYVDDDASGAGARGRLWFDAPNAGEIVLGPRAGASILNRLYIRGTTQIEGNAIPLDDTTGTVGTSGRRWASVWAVDGTINTSDDRTKVDVAPSDLGLAFLLAVGADRWRRRDGGRPHYGPTAQKVKKAMDDLDVEDFAGFIDPSVRGDEGPLGLRYHEFIGPIITALGEVNERLATLEAA